MNTLLPPKWFLTLCIFWLGIAFPLITVGIVVAEELWPTGQKESQTNTTKLP